MFEVENLHSNLSHLNLSVINEAPEGFFDVNSENTSEIVGGPEIIPSKNDDEFKVPDETLVEKIIQQVEFLFSDANILKDKFLLKHIRRNKEGYVSLKLISSLRKVKALCKDWRVIAYSLQKSTKLILNEEKTKIKRRESAPLLEDTDTSTTVLAFHALPICCTPEIMQNMLSEFGKVMSISVVNSSADKMTPIVQRSLIFYENTISFPFAIVKFENPDEVSNAILQTCRSSSILRIVPLLDAVIQNAVIAHENSPKNGKKLNFSESTDTENFSGKVSPEGVPIDNRNIVLRNTSPVNYLTKAPSSKERYNAIKTRPVAKEKCFATFQEKEESFLPCTYKGDSSINNKRLQRKQFIGLLKDSSVIILRQPKGPDGSRGFIGRRIEIPSPLCVTIDKPSM